MRRLILALALVAAPAAATPLEDRLREQLRAVTTQLRDLQSGQGAAEAGRIAAEKERDALKARLGAGGGGGSSRELASANSRASALASRLAAAEASLADARARGDAAAARLAAAEAALAEQRNLAAAGTAAVAARAGELQACTDRNARLVTTGRELVALHIKRYGNGDFPPLQLLRTRIENEAQAQGDRITVNAMMVNAEPAPVK